MKDETALNKDKQNKNVLYVIVIYGCFMDYTIHNKFNMLYLP